MPPSPSLSLFCGLWVGSCEGGGAGSHPAQILDPPLAGCIT